RPLSLVPLEVGTRDTCGIPRRNKEVKPRILLNSDSPSFNEFFVERRVSLVARLVDRHDVGARTAPAALLDQVGQRLIDQGLKLPSLAARKVAAGLMNPARPR
ncbi:MAG: hypothetical protein J4F48_11550, partial [Nitrospinae bacterium]|nr:hypothetical protein [Nitrospinota bacterium]